MTTKERAKYLIEKYSKLSEPKIYALFFIDGIISELNDERSIYEDESHRLDRLYYWEQVKFEIKNL